MVFTAQQHNSKDIPVPVETSRMTGFGALSCAAVNQQLPTPAAPAKTGATRIPSAVNFSFGQYHSLVQLQTLKSDKFMWIFTSYLQA